MCLPSSWDTMTARERLAGVEAMRKHHRDLTEAYISEMRCAPARGPKGPAERAFDAHTKEHNDFVSQRRQRLLAERRERIK